MAKFPAINKPYAARILCLLALIMPLGATLVLAQSPSSSDSTKDSPATNKEKPAPNHIILPTCSHKPAALYTEEAKAAKIQGSIIVQGIIGLDGRITSTQVIKGLGYGLDESALDIMKKWKCSPAVGPDGKPVPAKVSFQVNFKLY